MEKLLQWSLAQQGNNKEAKERVGRPDPKALAQLLGMVQGKDDPTLMKENGAVLKNEKSTSNEKLMALKSMEALIENLDNANNLKNMKLWPSILEQLNNEDKEIQALACSCIGSAVQNNPRSQNDFLEESGRSGAFKKILKLASDSTDEYSRSKALYALSNITRHSERAYEQFEDLNGWQLIPHLLADEKASDKLKFRALSLLSSLISEEVETANFNTKEGQEKINRLKDDKIVDSILNILDKDRGINCLDKAIFILSTLISHGFEFTDIQKNGLSSKIEGLDTMKDRLNEDDFKNLRSVVGK